MTNFNKDNELINLLELESNPEVGNKVACPKCSHDTVIKKQHQIDLPKTVGFVFFLGASMAMVILINAIVMIREKMKINRLPNEIKKNIEKNDKMSLLGLHVPTKIQILCQKCHYVFYENYDSGDMIVVFIFFVLIIVVTFSILFFFLR
jgi:hypothetical protein